MSVNFGSNPVTINNYTIPSGNIIVSNSGVAAGSDSVDNVIVLSAAEYAAATPESGVLYIIEDENTASFNTITATSGNFDFIIADSGITVSGVDVLISGDNITRGNHASLGSGTYNNWNPTVTAEVVRVTTTGSLDITGLISTYARGQLTMTNFGSHQITLKQDSASSDAANRFYNMPHGDLILQSGDTATFTYDESYSRWLVYGAGQATKIVTLTQSEYNALSSYDPNTLYFVT